MTPMVRLVGELVSAPQGRRLSVRRGSETGEMSEHAINFSSTSSLHLSHDTSPRHNLMK